jgi:hypothetical protein
MKILPPLFATLLLMGALCIGTQARTPVGILRGTVVDMHGNAISGATVMIQTSDGRHPHATRTDAAGQFSFNRFAVGQYDLRAYYQGSSSDWARRISIGSHKPSQITLRIPPPKT